MKFAILCRIDAQRLELFGQLRAEHYRYLIEHRDRILFGGPTRIADGGRPETMIIVLEAESLQAAHAFIEAEPYSSHGGFDDVQVRPWSQVLPEAEPGDLQRTYETEMRNRGIDP